MKIELIENTEFGFYNIKFGSRPDYEHNADMLNELKANGWAWSRHNGVWYPRTTDAKAKANTFAAEFAKKYNEPEKSFGQELFERTQRIDQWKKEHLPQEQNNEPVKEESKPVELNDNQKKVYDLLKATNNFSENQILEMVSKIDTAYQTENFNIPELSWEEIKSFIHADDSFDLAKDLRDLYNPNISETYNKINVVYNYLHDLMDFDVLGENQYERSADEEYHTMRESIRHDILQPVCENIVMDRYSDFFDMQEDFISRREEKIADISKSYMENPVIKEQYIGMKRAELLEKSPEMLKGREFNSWIFNINNDGHFLFYESNGYLKSEYLNDAKYNSVKDFLSQVEELDLLEESSKQLKEEYTKMHSLLEKPPVQIQDELIAKEVEEELANADERIDTSVSEYNDLGIDTRTGEPWNGEESEDVFEPEIQEEGSTELTQADLDNATKVIPEEQYQFMLENAAGEEAEYFKKKLKNMATICTDLQKHSNKENVNKDGSHPCKLHYFLGNCDWYISELDNDGIGFGYCILNGDLYNSEWGSVNVCGDSTYEQPLTKMSINVPIRINGSEFNRSVSPELDLHLDEDTTIERELYKLDNEYFADYKKYAEKDEKILAKSSEVSINIIEETNQELEVENGSKTDIGYERRTGISSGSNPNQGLEERGAYSDRGSDTGRGQRVLHSEREENGSLENSEGISELHTVGRESEISDLHIEEIQSGNNEVLHSERSLETGNSDLQQTGMENGQIPHRVRTVEPEHGTGVNPNENTSSEPLHGNEEVIEEEADELFKKITEQYDTQYKDFYDTYNKMKESYTENESRYVSDARIGDMFRQVHRELVSLQMNELTDLIKQASNADIARINATRYFNFCGQDEFSYLHDNLYLRCNLGDYTKDNGRRFVAPTGEELQNFIEETYNSLHGIVAEKETPVYNINGTEYTQETIETLITEDIQNLLNDLNPVPVIEGVRLYQNPERTGKVNILLQYNAKENETNWREDDLFNAIMVENLSFNGISVDVNPITPEKSGTIEQYLERFESLGITNKNEAIAKQAEMLDEQFDFAKLADDICQQSYEQSAAGFNYYIYFDEIAGLAGKDVAWVKENIEKIGEALEEHNDELLLDFNLKEALEEDSLDLNFCSVGEDVNELFKKDDSGRWVRKTDKELAYERSIDEHSSKWDELESAFSGLETFRGNFEEIKREVFEQHLDNNERFNETQWQEETVYRLLEENISISKEQVVSKEPDQLTSKKDIKAIREQCREILEKYDNTHLNEKEWKILNEMESENERHFVEESLRSTKYLLCTIRDENGYWDLEHGKEITANEARKMLGTSEFMSGLDRACFHWTSGRNTPDGKAYIHFDDSDRDRVVSPYEFTKEDLSILAQYEGAGGIKEDNRTVSGILNEFYTPNNLVEKVWQIVDAYAPNAKTVLEPSAGVGKFANNRPNNEFTMHELDETSARINKILHPEANVIQGAYQKQFFDAGERIHTPGQKSKYDVVIGNPPYGTYNDKYKGLGEGKEFDRYEEYFISKGLDALKDENSVMVFVVPSGFLNTASDKQKEIIAAKGRLIDAYRLPVGTFPTTEVGTDIIIMRTWEKDRKIIMENGKGNAAYKQASLDEAIELISDNISNGEWFKQHPEKILGEVKQKTNRFGKLEDVVVVHEGLTVQDELNKIDNFVEGINNSRKLRTYSVLNKDKINELTVVTQEEFNSIIDALYNQPSPDYKSIPSIIKLPQINQTLAQKLGVENANFFMRSEIAHVRPQRKGNYDQALRIDEMKGMLNFLKSCQTAYIDNDERHQNFILAGLDSQNSNKTNKIVFNKDENGNYIVTIGKVDSVEFNGGKYSRVAVGFEPTILRSKLEVWSPIATMLRSSTTPLDSTIPQQTEKSSQIIAPAPVQPEQTQSVSDQSETVAEEIDDPTKRLYEDPDGVFKTKHQLTREEFAKFYTGANFTQEDYNIWGATDWKGNVDTSKLTESELSYLKTSDNYVETNEGVYTNAMLYATGNIYQKLDELEENKENLSSESYEKAKAILTNAIPKVVPIENIKIDALSPLAQEFKVHREVTSSRWYMGRTELQTVELDIDLREDFINWATNCSSLDNFDENNQSINSRRSIYNYSSAKISREDIPEDISWTDIVNYIDRVPVPTHIDEKNDTKEVKNKKNLIAGNIKDARKNTCYELFNRYIQDGLQQEDKERLQSTWNRIYNATVHADYKKLPLFIDGMSTFKNNQPFMLYKQQVEGVSRLLSKGNGLLAYEVGVGKTAAGIVTTMGQLQTGRCKRPLIIVPNQVYKKWVNDFRELFPDVKINELYNLSEKYIDKHFDERTHSLLIEPGSVTVITDSALQKITFSDAVCSKELAEDFSYLLGVSDALHSGDDKEKAKAYQKIQNEIGKASRVQVKKLPEGREQRIQQSYIFFDECGFDNVVIDEAHRYKNLFTIPRPKRGDKGAREFEGLGTGKPSIRAEKVFGITTLIQRRNEDRNVFLLTATPFTNNPLEVYSMLSYMGRKELINRHIYDVRDFCTEFAQTKFEYSVKPTGDIEPKQVMKNFRGQKKLKNLVFEYIDAVSAKEAGIERPEGERHPIYLELSTLQQKIIKLEQDAIAASDDPSVTLKAMTTMRTCTLSPALLEPDDFASVEDIVIPPKSQIVESSPKLSWVCNTVADLYKQKPECGQFIYMPQGKDCFDEVKKYLIKQGIPDDAIDYIHSTHNGSAEDKDKISARFNNKEDKLKILIGTATVAEGIDLNGNSIVEYNTMLGWNPTESIQVEGRIWRQGNEQGKVHIMYPLMENSIDALIYQKHDEKASRINSVLSKTDDGKDAIDTDEINPENIKFELITDPTKKVKMIIDEKTAEKRKEIKVIDNRLETIQELEEDRQNSKTLYDTNVEEKEKYKSLLKTAREELKADPNNWQKEARVTSNERAVDTCNKEIAKARNRLNTISYNFNKFDIHEPEREVPIKLQELVTKKAELEADITDIENSKDRLIAEEQKKLLEKKILSKPVEELRKEWVEYVNKNTWYKKHNDKSKDRKETVQVPLEAVKDFKVPDEMIKKFDKAMAEMDFKVLHNYLNWGDRDIINDCHENDKAIVILRERYEKTKGVKLPEQFRKTTEYLVSVCDEKTLPEVCKFKSMEEAVACACSSWHGEAYQRDGYVEYVTLDNFKRNRDVSALAKDFQKREGQSYHGHGSPNGFGYDCSPKGVKIEAFINKKREEFFVNWNQVAKIKAKQWNREYPAEFTIKDEPKREGEEKLKNIQMVQQDLFDFDEVKVQTKTLDIRMQGYNSQFIISDQALVNYRGLPPFMKKSNDEWVIRCKGEDFAKPQEGIASYELVDISLTKEQLQGMVKAHLFAQQQEISHKKFDDPEYKGKVICPKSEVSDMQKELLKSNGISDNDLKKVTKENFNELLCDGEKPILKKKLPQPKQLKQENNQKLLPSTTIEIAEDTDFDYVY